jgi:hypothetical protein
MTNGKMVRGCLCVKAAGLLARTPQRALGEHSVNAGPMPAAAGEFTHVVVLSIARDGRSVPPSVPSSSIERFIASCSNEA